MPPIDQTLIGSALVLLGACCYGFYAIFTKLIYRYSSLGPFDVTAWRFLIASLVIWVLWPLWRRQVNWHAIDRKRVLLFLCLGGLMAILALVGFSALERISATTYTLLLYTFPAMVALASLALGERLFPMGWAALGLALVGCALTVGEAVALDDPLGVALVLLNALLYGAYLMAVGQLGRGAPGLLSSAIIIPGALIALAPFGIARGLQVPHTSQGWLAVLGLSVISTVLAIVLVFAGTTRVGASKASILSTMEPVLTVIWAAILLGEHIKPIQYIGGGLIIASVILLNLPPRPTDSTAGANSS
jgi:drug/metabolite transporter (DMT)-like permease